MQQDYYSAIKPPVKEESPHREDLRYSPHETGETPSYATHLPCTQSALTPM